MAILESEIEIAAKNAYEKRLKLAEEVLDYTRSRLVALMPFLNRALLRMPVSFYRGCPDEMEKTDTFGSDGHTLFAYADNVLYTFGLTRGKLPRLFLHTILHCLFLHFYDYEKLILPYWDLACDAAVEAVILEMNHTELRLPDDPERGRALDRLREKCGRLTAEAIYRYLADNREEAEKFMKDAPLFALDGHTFWTTEKEMSEEEGQGRDMDQADAEEEKEAWEKLARHVTVDVRTFQRDAGTETGTLLENLGQVLEERHDFTEFLRKFAVFREDMKINREEFDYVYYTYGLELYGDMPLVEPLEYQENKRVRDFAIVIDTSGSCRGELVSRFLGCTWSILSQCTDGSHKVNIHIIQCDAAVKKDVKITSVQEFERYVKDVQIYGYGGTDFRPAFAYVDDLVREGEFEDLKGLIYFTDGRGTYPAHQPDYKTAFVFADHDPQRPKVPAWAISLEVREEELKAAEEALWDP